MDLTMEEQSEAGLRLPVEIIDSIFKIIAEHSDYKSLASLARANGSFCEQARAILYHTISTLSTVFGGQPQCLKDAPHLAKYVHTYIVRHSSLCMHLDTRATDVRPLHPRAKAKLVNLKELSIELNSYLPQKFLQFKTAPFQLEKLRWTDCPNVDTLIVFLKTQTRLRRLEVELEDRCGWQQLPSQYCSELEYLKGNRAIVETILPGRKVSILDWDEVTRCCFEGESWPRSLVHLSEEFGNLKALRLLKWGDGSPFSYVLPQYLKNLQYIALSHEEPELFSIFSMLPCLVGVILPFHSAQKRDTGYLRTPSETGKLFRCSATLQFIDIQCRRAGIKMVNERWTASFDRGEGCIQKELISSSIEEHMYL